MNENNKLIVATHSKEDLKYLQSLKLHDKIQISITRILEWYNHWDNQCYVSFSGGKDSTVLADIAAKVCKLLNCELTLWFSDTGLEYPEVKTHVKDFSTYLSEKYNIQVNLVMDYPKDRKGNRITFRQVLEKYGYPIISKEVSHVIKDARNAYKKGNTQSYAIKQLNGTYTNKLNQQPSPIYDKTKWKFLLDAPFLISNQCCTVMKKQPAHKYDKQSGKKPILGTMTVESHLRRTQWLQQGCNAFNNNHPSSKPISFWTEQDILEYIVVNNLPIASVYGEVIQDNTGKFYTTGAKRTGCVFCCYGCHLEKSPNRFQQLKQTHPKLYEYCMKSWDSGGLGLKEVLDFINVETE